MGPWRESHSAPKCPSTLNFFSQALLSQPAILPTLYFVRNYSLNGNRGITQLDTQMPFVGTIPKRVNASPCSNPDDNWGNVTPFSPIIVDDVDKNASKISLPGKESNPHFRPGMSVGREFSAASRRRRGHRARWPHRGRSRSNSPPKLQSRRPADQTHRSFRGLATGPCRRP